MPHVPSLAACPQATHPFLQPLALTCAPGCLLRALQALCCSYCKGSTEKVCLNAYDEDNNLYNACAKKTPESDAPCYNPDAEIPEHPSVVPGEPHQLPELETRNLCRSHIAFDYDTWSFRKGFRSLCCSYCAAGSMVSYAHMSVVPAPASL